MRILYFADIRFPLERANGIQTMETCHALAERGHEVRLVVKPDTRTPARDPFEFYGLAKIQNLVIERANMPPGAGLLQRVGYMSFVFGRAFGKTRADVIMTRDLGVASALLAIPSSMRAPVVFESHGYAPDVADALPELVTTAQKPSSSKLKRLAEREASVWRRAEGYVTITNGLADELGRRFGRRDRLAVIADGTRMPATPPGSLPQDPLVAYAGHLYAWKGVDVLLRALATVREARGVIVGGHEEEPDLGRLRSLAVGLGIQDRVAFAGLVPPGEVHQRLCDARILALPNPASAISTHFTSPLKLFEYMAARRPIVASDLPAIREVLTHRENALLVAPGDADSLAAAIRILLDDSELGQRLADSAYRDAAKYTWRQRAERLELLLSQVASSG